MVLNQVLENIQLLKYELQKISSSIQNEIISVMIDGSVIRGDFIDESSDIDLTITTLHKNIDFHVKKIIEEVVRNVQSKLPKREKSRKPLIYDVQWQDIHTVKECGKSGIYEWSFNNVPSGYPKLWLYAFDSIKHHVVIYGQDLTGFYTKIAPQYFIPIRMKRLQKSIIELGEGTSAYDEENGTITQLKNAWEILRCISIEQGFVTIIKNDIFLFCRKHFSDTAELIIIEEIYNFYLNQFHNSQPLYTNALKSIKK